MAPSALILSPPSQKTPASLNHTEDPKPSTTPISHITGSKILQRDHVYCYDSFEHRIRDWERESRTRTSTPDTRVAPVSQPVAPVTRRVQPSRTAKKPISSDPLPPTIGSKRKRKREEPDYILVEPVDGETGDLSPTRGVLSTIMQAVRHEVEIQLQQARRIKGKAPQRNSAPTPLCSIVELPLGCTDMAYCLHGLALESETKRKKGRTKKQKVTASDVEAGRGRAEEPEMIPTPSLGRWTFGEAEEAGMRESKGVLDVCGLRFKVDLCNGWVKIVMV